MARNVFKIVPTQGTQMMCGITDDGVTMRVHPAHFFNAGGRDMATYTKPELWSGKIEDWTEDAQAHAEAVMRGGAVAQQVKAPVKKVMRRSRA